MSYVNFSLSLCLVNDYFLTQIQEKGQRTSNSPGVVK